MNHTQPPKQTTRRRSLILIAAGAGIALFANFLSRKSSAGPRRSDRHIRVTQHPNAVQRARRNVNV
ncbi:MAG: hypothetical protein FJ215_06260 [Ignavibacteria bacterium]|nr:hypothetical protein [Ignavibacteria bacterium]